MSEENKSMQQRVEHEFVNSNDTGESLWRLLKDPPVAIVRRLVAKFIGLIVSIMDRMLELLGLSLTDPDKLYENASDATKKVKLLTMIMIKVLEDPVVRENVKQLAIALNDSALKPFFAVALITIKQMEPAIDEAEKQLIERLKEGIRRAGDGAWDAFENVIAGVPGIGNAWSAFSALTSAIQAGQTIVQTSLQLILESTYRILGTLRKANVPGLEAVDSFVDFGLNAYNVYTNLTNKFDEINATMQQMNFTPTETLTKKKIVEDMKAESDAAEALMPGGLNAAMNPEESNTEEKKPEETKPEETKPEEKKPEEKKPEETKPEETKPEEKKPEEKKPQEAKTIKKGGSRKKRKKYKRKTRKRALKKRH